MSYSASVIVCGCLVSCAFSLILIVYRLGDIHRALASRDTHEDAAKPVETP
jgi:hypothetical protein